MLIYLNTAIKATIILAFHQEHCSFPLACDIKSGLVIKNEPQDRLVVQVSHWF